MSSNKISQQTGAFLPSQIASRAFIVMMLCTFCDGLSISLLIDLAKIEFEPGSFPQQAYYQHQASYTNLVCSAENGCSLCGLILRGFQEIIISYNYSPWKGMTRDQAASQIESEGEASDIRICIDAEHLYTNGKLDQVELFDILRVQVGAPEPIPTSEPSDSEDDFIPPLVLGLSVAPGKLSKVGRYRVGRFQIDPVLASPSNYTVAKHWLDDCWERHRDCPRKQLSKLPTRVIDVGMADGQQSPRLVVSNGVVAKYAALSHCWGGKVSPLLSKDNLKPFQDVIPLSDLPDNFQDAISITRQLGIKYLWIDCLCIIQDSTQDWEEESKMMGSIYRNALVTISAATSQGSTDGILRSSLIPSKIEEPPSPELSIDSNSSDKVQVSLKDEEEESLRDLFLTSLLMKRGWTLQEAILSPRILYYGERQIYWKCPQGFQSADGVPPGNLMPEDWSYSEITKFLHSSSMNELSARKPDLNLILDNYYKVVQDYSSRKLSFQSDKLPAFSGIPALIHPVLGGKYLAGIWSGDFRQGLLWYNEMGECRHTLSDQAPSWSWAVTNDPVVFELPARKGASSPEDAQLLDHKVELNSQNIYGKVSSGRLVVRGLTKKLFRSSQFVNFSDSGVARVYFDELEADKKINSPSVFEVTSETGSYLLSIRKSDRTEGENPTKELEMNDIDFDLISGQDYIVLMIESIPEDYNSGIITSANCLVLMRITDTDEYSRAGVLVFNHKTEEKFKTWVQTWERKTITMV